MEFGVGILDGLGDPPAVRDLVTCFASPSADGIELVLVPPRSPGTRLSNPMFSCHRNEGVKCCFELIDVFMREIDFICHAIESETKTTALVVVGDRGAV